MKQKKEILLPKLTVEGEIRGSKTPNKILLLHELERETPSRNFSKLIKKYLNYLVSRKGGPVGIDDIAFSIGENKKILQMCVEPYLIRLDYIHKTVRGRLLTKKGIEYLGLKMDDVIKKKMESTGLRYTKEETKIGNKSVGEILRDWVKKKKMENKYKTQLNH